MGRRNGRRQLELLLTSALLLGCRDKPKEQRPAPAPAVIDAAPITQPSPSFVEMYVAGWSLKDHPASTISYVDVTDAILFSLLPTPDSRLDARPNGLTDERIAAVTKRAHQNGVRVLVAIGGEKTASLFTVPHLEEPIAHFVKEHELDGVVLDIEPLAELPHEKLAALVHDTKEAIAPRTVEMVVAPSDTEIARLGPLVGDVDRVVVMSYLGEPPEKKERELVDELVALGFDRTKIGLGIGPKTLIEARKNRLERVREGAVGGTALWGIMDGGGLRP